MIINSSSNLYGNEGAGAGASAEVAGSTLVSGAAAVETLFVLAAALVAGALASSATAEIFDFEVSASAQVAGASIIDADAYRVAAEGALVRGATAVSARASRSLAASSGLVLTARILPEASSSPFINQTARLTINGVEIGVRSFMVAARPESLGFEVEIELARPTLATVDLATQDIVFELGTRSTPGGAFAWETIIDADAINRHSYRTAFAGRSLSISLASGLDDKLARAPSSFTTLYDPDRVKVDYSDVENIPIETGGNLLFTVEARPVLNLYDALFYLAKKCGFSGYQTNAPNFQIERVDFSPLETYLDAVSPILGVLEPYIFERDNKLVVLEPTAALPAGFEPLDLTSAEFTEYEHEFESEPLLPGFLINYEQTKTRSTTHADRTTTPTPDEIGVYGTPGYSKTEYVNRYRDYFETGNPTAIKTEMLEEKRTTIGSAGSTIARETETHALDAQGRRKSTTNTIEALVPVLNGSTEKQLLTVKVEKISYSYKPDPENPARYIIAKKTTETTGLIAIDSDNKYLDENFEQGLLDGHKTGNLKADMTTRFGAISTTTEIVSKLGGGQAQTKITKIDHLAGTTTNSLSDLKSGEISVGGFESKPGRLIVYRDDIATVTKRGKIENFSLGALPLAIGLPLAKRKLKARIEGRRRGSVSFRGFDYHLRRGATYRVLDREGALMNCIVLGFSITGEALGTREQNISTRLDVAEI